MESLSIQTRSENCLSHHFRQEQEFLEVGYESMDGNSNPTTGSLLNNRRKNKSKKTKKNQVFLEATDEDDLTRTKSLTGEDLDELKGCLDLGFGFSYEEIPELCNTLPALELCYSMSQRFLDDQNIKSPESPRSEAGSCSPTSGPIANWKISSPGDRPEDVKARLKYWAQAVACTVKLCN